MSICAENYLDNQLANNVIIDNCIKKCFEELSQPPSKSSVAKSVLAKNKNFNDKNQIRNEDPKVKGDSIIKEHTHRGVGLGDWIFNNSSENYEKLNQGKEMYRKKICENWIISLSKPKPKDINDSLQSVKINNVQQGDNLFKKPLPRKDHINRKKSVSIREKPKIKSLPPVSTQTYKPSQYVKAFDNSSLMRASRKLVLKAVDATKANNPTKNRNENRKKSERKLKALNSFENLNLSALDIPMSPPILDISLENLNTSIDEINTVFKQPDIENISRDHPPIYKTTKKTLDFELHKNERATNFNMNFSSSIAIHTINDPFMGFLENDVGEMQSISNLFENNVSSTNNMPFGAPSSELNRRSGSSMYSQVSHYRQHSNNSIRTHYRHQTYCNFNNNNSLNSDRQEVNSRVGKNERHRSVRGSSNSTTTVAPIDNRRSSIGLLNDEVRQTGWPVTININFGQSK